MHIAFLTPEYPHTKLAHAAGIGTSIQNLAKALVHQGVKVTILVYGQKEQKVFTDNEIQIHSIKYKKFQFLTWFFHRKYIENYCNSVIKQQKIDLIEAADWTGITAFMKFKIPLLIRFHGSDTYFCHLEKRKQKWKNFFLKKMLFQKQMLL
ncbi:glycosyltransferase [Flavobacterium nitratireducens]|uniref:glycosyltransferase n=1 Tax=Flavobacterium nitratireducens TaxID=992289 RepID=UPI0030F86A4F